MTAPTEERRLGVDPRLRARRQDVLREQGRRRLRRAQAIVAVVAVAASGWAGAMSSLLDVDKVVVRGLDPDRAAEVEMAAGIEAGAPLATLDVDRVRATALAVPWVATATVSRSWPGSVLIEVTERRAVAVALVPDGTTVLVDAERQLAVDGRRGLPRLVGAVVEARPGAPLDADASGALELAVLLDGVAVGDGGSPEITVDDQGALEVVFRSEDGGTVAQVAFGRPVDLDDKVRALRALLQSEALIGDAGEGGTEGARTALANGVIDVRVPSAPVVTRPRP